MIGATAGSNGLNTIYLTQPAMAASAANALNSPPVPGSTGQSSASISGPGQLLSNLQQLQATNQTQFQKVTTQIANQLQNAAKQTQGQMSNLLSNLSAKFQSVANGGGLSQLQEQQQQHHHHHHRAQQAYSQASQTAPQGLQGLMQTTGGQAGGSQSNGSQSSDNNSAQGIFASISNAVSAALKV
jgi:hypothetical protein